MKKESNVKKNWSRPVLTAYGSVAELTKQNKVLGSSDGFLFQGNAIKNAS